MNYYAKPVARLIDQLAKLPVSVRNGAALGLSPLNAPAEVALELAKAIEEAKKAIRYCSVCGNFTDEDPCFICGDERRRRYYLCSGTPRDVVAMEKARGFKGLYHVLQGAISPMKDRPGAVKHQGTIEAA